MQKTADMSQFYVLKHVRELWLEHKLGQIMQKTAEMSQFSALQSPVSLWKRESAPLSYFFRIRQLSQSMPNNL